MELPGANRLQPIVKIPQHCWRKAFNTTAMVVMGVGGGYAFGSTCLCLASTQITQEFKQNGGCSRLSDGNNGAFPADAISFTVLLLYFFTGVFGLEVHRLSTPTGHKRSTFGIFYTSLIKKDHADVLWTLLYFCSQFCFSRGLCFNECCFH